DVCSSDLPFRMNILTACFLWLSKLPIAFPTDRECIQAGLAPCWQPNRDQVRLAIIPNTLELADMWVSRTLLEEVAHAGSLCHGELQPLPFDPLGSLRQEQLFPHSIRGLRTARIAG